MLDRLAVATGEWLLLLIRFTIAGPPQTVATGDRPICKVGVYWIPILRAALPGFTWRLLGLEK